MTPEFYEEYLKSQKSWKQKDGNLKKGEKTTSSMFYICNPNKFIACEYLVELHEARGDKIIVFSD